MSKAVVALGSNLGDRKANLESAIEKIAETEKVLQKSKIYETEPVGFKEQGWFLNQVIEIETEKTPRQLLGQLLVIENQLNRVRDVKNGPRTIDLDILYFGDLVIEEDSLKVPHSRMEGRKFVLIPLNDILPEKIHPKTGKTSSQMLKELKSDEKVSIFI